MADIEEGGNKILHGANKSIPLPPETHVPSPGIQERKVSIVDHKGDNNKNEMCRTFLKLGEKLFYLTA
eukprot:CAMPEP_0195519692 /NCGR_PEP_ID=MMETSP0794_2-20130614/15277_1 /TAXON_ID=515487 /ORGANISM="Stephanopyxis turris, Strain CCMP 815" /LENGTH=67 /DNA_ID=CAMNT_0040648885 /DNA_START=39 /DNA_END=238 /DNA_ORIENTATION=+